MREIVILMLLGIVSAACKVASLGITTFGVCWLAPATGVMLDPGLIFSGGCKFFIRILVRVRQV